MLRGGTGGLGYYHRNQQYRITALTNGSAAIQERYAYTVYGAATITDASGTTRTATAEGNRFTYTGREWDEELNLYHFRARMYDPVAGRFLGKDPIGYERSPFNLYEYVSSSPLARTDPTGLEVGIGGHGGIHPKGSGPLYCGRMIVGCQNGDPLFAPVYAGSILGFPPYIGPLVLGTRLPGAGCVTYPFAHQLLRI